MKNKKGLRTMCISGKALQRWFQGAWSESASLLWRFVYDTNGKFFSHPMLIGKNSVFFLCLFMYAYIGYYNFTPCWYETEPVYCFTSLCGLWMHTFFSFPFPFFGFLGMRLNALISLIGWVFSWAVWMLV